MGPYRGGGWQQKRPQVSIGEGGGLKLIPWVSIEGGGAGGGGGGGGKADTMGLFKGVGGYKGRQTIPLILVGPELVE